MKVAETIVDNVRLRSVIFSLPKMAFSLSSLLLENVHVGTR